LFQKKKLGDRQEAKMIVPSQMRESVWV